MVSSRPLIAESSSPFNNIWGLPKAPITTSKMSPSCSIVFFQFPSKVKILILLFTFFQFYSVVSRDSKVDNFPCSLFFCRLLLGLVFWSRLGDPFVWHSPIKVCVSFSRTDAGLYIYHLVVWSDFKFLDISQWITSPSKSCLVLYSFCGNLLHSLITWLMVSSLSQNDLYLLLIIFLL